MTACGGRTSGSSPTAASTCFDGRLRGPSFSRSRVNIGWETIDPQVELATKLGLEIFYPIVHFNLPSWLASNGEKHAVFADQLPDRIAEYTDRLLTRYKFRLVIPVVEVQMDAFQRGRAGNWQPHGKSASSYAAIYERLVHAYKASARVAKMHGATVFCSEPATEIQTVLDLSDVTDIAGIDLYPHMHQQRSIIGFFRWWWHTAHMPLCISEFGTPETYDRTPRSTSSTNSSRPAFMTTASRPPGCSRMPFGKPKRKAFLCRSAAGIQGQATSAGASLSRRNASWPTATERV